MNNLLKSRSFKQSILVVLIMLVCSPASAQFNLGRLVNSIKRATESASSVVNTVKKVSRIGSVNPFPDVWRIDSIRAYGTKTSMNYGKVWLVINAEAIVPLERGRVDLTGYYGVVGGKSYKINASRSFEMPEGIPMIIDTNNKILLENIPASADEVQAYNLEIYIDGSRYQTVTWKHIPINWQ